MRADAIPPQRFVVPESPGRGVLERYRHYLEAERGLAPRTVESYMKLVSRFVASLERDGTIDWQRVQARDVTRFLRASTRQPRPMHAPTVVPVLRSFLRFALIPTCQAAVRRPLLRTFPRRARTEPLLVMRNFPLRARLPVRQEHLGVDLAVAVHARQAERWTWLDVVMLTQFRLARDHADEIRLPWERPREPPQLPPAGVRRGFRRLRAAIGTPASPPKFTTAGPGRPKGTRRPPRTRYPAIKKAA